MLILSILFLREKQKEENSVKTVQLPVKNASGNYEIRLESIGGLGANLCGKMLGELGIKYLGLNSAGFSSYGSEKTGTPVKGYVRYSEQDQEIRVHSPVVSPHLLCIFHEALMSNDEIFKGCTSDTVIVINTLMSDTEIKKMFTDKKLCAGKVMCAPAQNIAMETHSRVNVIMLGAMAKAMGFVKLDDVFQICKNTLGRKYPDALAGNLEGIRRGYEEVREVKVDVISSKIENNQEEEEPEWGYETAPIGGINPRLGSTVVNDLSPSRQGYIPVFLQERCINCGLCDSTCPDMVFQFEQGEYKGRQMMVNKGLDYYHCKGCLRCVSVCPTQALVKGIESEHPDKKWFLPNQELLRTPDYYEKAGADGYITSESYLTEKRMEGGEV